ncbi:M14 family zinc carboxypeptidase [Sphingobacterium sp. LRF_L2]|uniref:M14 family zinc carboxypeptidase n=1 Tax=Sphingobacterium sp. LRF_L2 TaxID=3369421 RepID=UPI003F621942
MKVMILILATLVSLQSCTEEKTKAQSDYRDAMTIDTAQFNNLFEKYRESKLFHRRFKHSDIDSLIQFHREKDVLEIAEIGRSAEKRSIYKLKYGQGNKKVMLWSQMHGDEPTATMALFDIFNFLEGKDDRFDSLRNLLNEHLEIHFIPMLNPDGAERYTRRNAQQIDLNRDARATQTVEGALLKRIAQEVKPSFGFNLHDQSIYYNVPETKNPVTISLLAPAYNQAREVNEVRKGAMQIIVGINTLLQQYVPNAVAKYDDTYSPRGFGDNFQSWGASTVLIESGGKKGDPEKQEIRRLNFAIILNALLEIAQDSYKKYEQTDYDKIPFNAMQLNDVLLRNVQLTNESVPLKTDVAIRRTEITVDRDFFVRGHIEDLGDLEDLAGYEEIDAQGLNFVQGKVYPESFESMGGISMEKAWQLLKEGYIAVKIKGNVAGTLHDLPLVLFTQSNITPTQHISLLGSSNFFLGNGQELRYAIVNGYLIDLKNKPLEKYYKNRIN